MSKQIEALKLAEEALEELHYSSGTVKAVTLYKSALAAIREALAEPDWYEEAMRLGGLNAKHVGELKQLRAEPVKQEPVAYWSNKEQSIVVRYDLIKAQHSISDYLPLYAAPVDAKAIRAEREWVDLTDAELNNLWIGNTQNGWLGLFRAVIAADREKNK